MATQIPSCPAQRGKNLIASLESDSWGPLRLQTQSPAEQYRSGLGRQADLRAHRKSSTASRLCRRNSKNGKGEIIENSFEAIGQESLGHKRTC